jgi:hypothetical protein
VSYRVGNQWILHEITLAVRRANPGLIGTQRRWKDHASQDGQRTGNPTDGEVRFEGQATGRWDLIRLRSGSVM